MGITNTGVDSEELLCQYTKATLLPRGDALGDAVLNGDIFIEVKKTTLNQTRPNKYNVLVAHDTENNDWYVIPPDEVVRMTVGRRGQHTPDPMTCVGLGRITSKKFTQFRIPNISTLEKSIIDAYLKGQQNHVLKQFCADHKQQNEQRLVEVQKELSRIVV